MKKILVSFVIVILAVFSANAQHFSGLKVEKYSFDSVYPNSLRSVSGKVTLTVSNTGEARKVKDIKAVAYRNGVPFINGTCSDVSFQRGSKAYPLTGTVSLANGITVWTVIKAALFFNASEYTVDVTCTMTHENGSTEVVRKVGVPISNYIRR